MNAKHRIQFSLLIALLLGAPCAMMAAQLQSPVIFETREIPQVGFSKSATFGPSYAHIEVVNTNTLQPTRTHGIISEISGSFVTGYEPTWATGGSHNISLSFLGGGNSYFGSREAINTTVRAFVGVDPINVSFDIANIGPIFDRMDYFTPRLDNSPFAVEQTVNFAGLGGSVEVGSWPITLEVGAEVNLTQIRKDTLWLDGIFGALTATHRENGSATSQNFLLGGNGVSDLNFGLGEAGWWDFTFSPLSLRSRATSEIWTGVGASIYYGVGSVTINSPPVGTPWLSDEISPLYQNFDRLSGFSVFVAQSNSVPDSSSPVRIFSFALVLLGIAARRVRHVPRLPRHG